MTIPKRYKDKKEQRKHSTPEDQEQYEDLYEDFNFNPLKKEKKYDPNHKSGNTGGHKKYVPRNNYSPPPFRPTRPTGRGS